MLYSLFIRILFVEMGILISVYEVWCVCEEKNGKAKNSFDNLTMTVTVKNFGYTPLLK